MLNNFFWCFLNVRNVKMVAVTQAQAQKKFVAQCYVPSPDPSTNVVIVVAESNNYDIKE